MKRYFKKNGYHFVLTFNKKQVTFFSRSEFKGKDEAGNTHIIYGEESGVVLALVGMLEKKSRRPCCVFSPARDFEKNVQTKKMKDAKNSNRPPSIR